MASIKRKRSPSPLPSSSSTRQWKYEVFLSFSGQDTRKNFTDHLYAALKRNSIITFRDEEELEIGKSISKLFEAIEESHIAIIIFSTNYASSKWCLKELAKINERRKEVGLIVLPIFYDVEPSDVKKQIETFEQAFIDHQKCLEVNIKEVETWRTALKEVAIIKGWHLQDRHESEVIQLVVKEVMKKLSSKSSGITKNLVGIESELEKFIPSYLGFENNVCMTGIYGIGGLGKTTLARAVYDEFRNNFEGSSFIANVREDSKKHGLPKLQQQLLEDMLKEQNICVRNEYDGVAEIKRRLRCKKVLLVIDDVDCLDQLEKLAGRHDWFGLGSWIIITTRNEHVLIQHEVLNKYSPNGLNKDDALKLFCLKAFKNEQPNEGFRQLSQKVVNYANGLPLALVTFGSFLVGRTRDEWESALPSFKKTKGEIFNILKISYDGLEEEQKEIFLDIACFFRHWNKNRVIHILDNCGFDARIGIRVLLEKSLLSVDKEENLGMHDLLQEMGEKIVCFESKEKHGKQNRLWRNNDLLHVLKDNMATNAIEAMVIEYEKKDFKFEEFLEVLTKMFNLRLMILDEVKFDFCFLNFQRHLDVPNQLRHLDVPNQLRHLDVPNQLRHLSWKKCPAKCLSFNSQPVELVHLELPSSGLEYLWEGVMLSKLKFMNLSLSINLIRTPDFSSVPILEELNLSHCYKLFEIHPSIGQLSKLRYLDLHSCTSLFDLPSMSAKMQSPEVLDLSYCTNLIRTPDFSSVLIRETLDLSNCCKLVEIHPSIGQLSKLRYLDPHSCTSLFDLPSMSAEMQSLEVLDLSYCTNLIRTPDFSSVLIRETLDLSNCCKLVEIHPSIGQLSKLRYLYLNCCTSLCHLPSMSADMQSLEVLEVVNCPKINSFLKFTGIMKKLSKLRFCRTAIKEVPPSSIECLTALTLLDLRDNENLKCLPRNMHNLRSLEKLHLSKCSKLKSLPRLPSNVRVIEATFCYSLKLSSWSQPLSQWCLYDESDIQVEFKILFYFLQGLLCHKIVRGTSSKREEDGSITEFQIINSLDLVDTRRRKIFIELPANWYNDKWIGFALWASSNYIRATHNVIAHVTALGDMSQNHWDFELFTSFIYAENNICLLYLFRDEWFATVGDGKCSQIMVSFETEDVDEFLTFFTFWMATGYTTYWSKCGVSFIYEQDVDEFNQKNAPSLIDSFGEEVPIYKLTVGDDGDGDGDGGGGGGGGDDDDEDDDDDEW